MNTNKGTTKTAGASQNCAKVKAQQTCIDGAYKHNAERIRDLRNKAQGKPELPTSQDVLSARLNAKPDWANQPQAEHSPLPWRSFTRYVMSNGRFLATAHAIGDQASSSNGFAIGQEPTQDMNEAEANAKLIVASVNHAEALAEALRELNAMTDDELRSPWAFIKAREALANWEAAK